MTPARIKTPSPRARATLGPDTVYVGPGSVWANPYGQSMGPWDRVSGRVERAQFILDHYKQMATEGFVTVPYTSLEPHERRDGKYSFGAHGVPRVVRKYLGGKHLACTCDLDMPCHADVLLAWANTPLAYRIQLSRAKGARLPEGAVNCARPTIWGNPFKHADNGEAALAYRRLVRGGTESFEMGPDKLQFARNAHKNTLHHAYGDYVRTEAPKQLAGRALACWCALDAPCHVDVLVALANGERP